MLWLKRLFERGRSESGKEEREVGEEPQETTRLWFDQAEDWLKSQTADFFEKVNSNTTSSYVEIRQLLGRLEASGAALERATPSMDGGATDPRLEKIVLDNRTGLSSKIRAFVRSVKIPDDTESRTALSFYDFMLRQLNQFIVATTRNLNAVNVLFPEQMRDVTKTVNSIQNAVVMARKALETELDKIHAIGRARSSISDAHTAILKIRETKEQITESERSLRDLAEQKKIVEAEAGRFEESSEWQALQQLRASSGDTEAGLAQTERELSQLFSHMSKALKKFAPHAPAEEFDKSERKILDQYAEQPLLALDADAELKTIMKILESTQRLILSGKIELKEKLRAKAMAEIDRLRNTSVLRELLQKRTAQKVRAKELRGELERNEAAKKMAALKAEVARTGSELAQSRSGLETAKQSLIRAEKVVRGKLGHLTAALSAVSGKKIEILMPDL